MMLSCTIDAKEGRYIVLSDIPRAFTHADMDDNAYILFEGYIAEIIIILETTIYRNYIWRNTAH